MISCTGPFRSFWDICSLVLVLYCTFSVPYDMCFEPPKSDAASIVDLIVEAFFIIEIFLNFFTTYFDPDDGEEIVHPLFIAIGYIKSWMPIDLVSSIPSEMITRIYPVLFPDPDGTGGPPDALSKLQIIRILRLAKLLRLLRIKQLMEDIEMAVPSMRTVFGLFRLLFMMMILGHIQACIFYVMAKQNIGNSWVSKFHAGCCDPNLDFISGDQQLEMETAGLRDEGCFTIDDMPSLEVLYTNSIYWSFTTLTSVVSRICTAEALHCKIGPGFVERRKICLVLVLVAIHMCLTNFQGYGDITPCNEYEMIYATSSMLVGSGMFAYIVGKSPISENVNPG
jgi:hypothetical protein